MDYRERIQSKLDIVFQIAGGYLSEQLTAAETKEQMDREMVSIRPAQWEAVKIELGIRLKAAGSLEAEKLFDLFKAYLPPPYHQLEAGHPLRNYQEEINSVRSCLLAIDEMEGEEMTLESWREVYAAMRGFEVHVRRQEKNLYPLMASVGLRLQAEKAKASGNAVISQIRQNEALLDQGEIIEFLVNQRSLTQIVTEYLELEERVLFPKALSKLTNQDFQELRASDDQEGYAFIAQPGIFILKEEKVRTDSEFILQNLLTAKKMDMVYYTLSGELVSSMVSRFGDRIADAGLPIPAEIKERLLNGPEQQIRSLYHEGEATFLVTYSLATDDLGKSQGILKITEDMSEIRESRNGSAERADPKAIKVTGRESAERPGLKEIQEMDKDNAGESIPKGFQALAGRCKREERTIDSTTLISELFRMYPEFQADFYGLDEELQGLKGQWGMELLKGATVGMLAKSLRMETDDLVDGINGLLENY